MQLDAPRPIASAHPARAPRYLRVVVTRACPLACAYCHAEGDRGANSGDMTTAERVALVLAGVANGTRKVKLLGGEPLVAKDVVGLVRSVKAAAPFVDLSVITSGVAPRERIEALFDAGLDRANMSIHGWSADAFARRRGSERMRRLRDETLATLLEHGRPLKLNYVYGGPTDLKDLGELLEWAAGRPLVVNVLDDLSKDLGPGDVLAAVRFLRGPEERSRVFPDPDSLATLRLTWADGLEVEVKHQSLGALSPWTACSTCPARARCREGIHAVRLSYEGVLRPCMDREDLGIALLPVLRAGGQKAATGAWSTWIEEATR